MRDARLDALHRTLVVLAGLAAGWYLVTLVAAAGTGTGTATAATSAAQPLAVAFPLLAALAVVRALRAGRRPEDLLLAAGLVLSAAGWTYWALLLTPLAHPPYPSPADALWTALHPCAIVALAWYVGATWRARVSFTLDALIGAAGVTAAVAGMVVPAIVADGGTAGTVGVNAVYLGANAAHLLLLLSVLARSAFRHRGLLWLRLVAVAVLTATNARFLVDVGTTGVVPLGTLLDLGWLGAFAMLALSVGAGRPAGAVRGRWSVLVVPTTGTALALTVLLTDAHDVAAARWVAAAAVVLALARLGLAVADAAALAGSHEMALTDELTGLANRRGFYDALRQQVAAGAPVTVVLLDLNRFKDVNDTLGHRAGDVLLAQVARRLATTVRGGGRRGDLVARVGGDEFALLLPRADASEGVAGAWRFASDLATTYDVEGLAVRASAAAGVVHVPAHGRDIDELLRRADVAMYAAKAAHEAVVVYDPDLDTRTRDDLARLERLRAALLDGGLVLHYQPKVDLRTGDVVGVEALSRMKDDDGRLLLPRDFLPSLAHGGLLGALTTQVLERAVRQAARWLAAGLRLSVAVNVPADVLLGGTVADQVATVLRRHRLPGELLYVEVTEEALLSDSIAGRAAIEDLRELGVRVSIDDYGTGYSSLAYLRDLPLDEIKLDRSFVRGMADDPRVTRIVESTIALAHGLELRVVAEGVESEADRRAVVRAGCDIGQGYLFARPAAPDDIARLVTRAPGAVPGPDPFDRAQAGKEPS